MKTFRYYLDIDAKDRDDAQSQLEDMAASMSFGDLDFIEIPSEQWDIKELMKHFGIKDKYDIYNKIENHFVDFDGLLCRHCSESIGNEGKQMLDHLQTHTKEELETDEDGEPLK